MFSSFCVCSVGTLQISHSADTLIQINFQSLCLSLESCPPGNQNLDLWAVSQRSWPPLCWPCGGRSCNRYSLAVPLQAHYRDLNEACLTCYWSKIRWGRIGKWPSLIPSVIVAHREREERLWDVLLVPDLLHFKIMSRTTTRYILITRIKNYIFCSVELIFSTDQVIVWGVSLARTT